MPQFTQTDPNLVYIASDDLVKVNVTGTLRMRNAPSGTQTIAWLNGGEIVTRVEMAQNKVNGTYWDKVKSVSGVYGYVARETYENSQEHKLYLVKVEETLPEEMPEIGEGENNDTSNDDNKGENNEEAIEVRLGDVNNDGKISPTDYVLIKNHIMQVKTLQTDAEKKAADVNEDGKISATDYVLIKNHIMYGTEI